MGTRANEEEGSVIGLTLAKTERALAALMLNVERWRGQIPDHIK